MCIDTSTGKAKLIGPDFGPSTWKWRAAAVGGDGHIYCPPANATHVLHINTRTGVVDQIGPDFGGGASKWLEAVVAWDGHVYCPPANASQVLHINTETGEVALIGPDFGPGEWKWRAAAVGGDGDIYCPPAQASRVLRISTRTREVDVLGPEFESTGLKYSAAAVAENGNIYCPPTTDSSKVLLINSKAGSAEMIGSSFGDTDMKWRKWRAAVAGADGCVYCPPATASHALRINTRTNDIEVIGTDFGTNKWKWQGTAVGGGGASIYCPPADASRVLRIRTDTSETDTIGPDLGSREWKWWAATVAGDGCIYCPPANAPRILRIDPGTDEVTLIGPDFGADELKWVAAAASRVDDAKPRRRRCPFGPCRSMLKMASTALAGAGPPRRGAPGTSEPPDPEEEPRWEYLVGEQPEEWLPFRLAVHRLIEQTYLEPSSHDGEWQLVVEDDGQEYFLDLEAMVQTNTATHQQRRIRRNTRTSATNLAALLERERSESRQLASQLEREQAQKDQAEGRVAEQSRKLQEESAKLAEARRVVRMQRHEAEVWRHSHLPGNEASLRTAMPDQDLLVAAQAALRRTSHSTVSSRCLNMQSAIVTRVQPIINGPLWEEYTRTKARIEADQNTIEPVLPGVPPIISESFPWLAAHLNTQINERLAFHGTAGGNVSTIAERGFDEHCADEDCLYGMGIYFAEESCKSFQYCGTRDERCIILVRMVLGKAYIAKGQLKGLRRPPLINGSDASAGRYDSVVANRGVPHGTGTTQLHREFVLFSGRQAYPELAIYFKI